MALSDFEYWAKKADIPWRVVQSELKDVMAIARATWRDTLNDLPIADSQKQLLIEHWQQLPTDFQI